ncbi:MAG: hypothetical protein JWR80_1222 [Bradyrhizobium sp.]|nr:hypothetical protein [Bradyrhizobium sp.]
MARKPALPAVVYKYYGPERTDALQTFRVRFSQLAALNDPFEFLIGAKPGDLRQAASRKAARMTNLLGLLDIGFRLWLRVGEHAQLKLAPRLVRLIALAVLLPFAIVMTLLLGPFIGKQMQKGMAVAADEIESLLFEHIRCGLVLIFSCSETWKSVPMWAHYAGNHTGFAIGLDPSAAFRSSNPRTQSPFISPHKVRYTKREPRINPLNFDDGGFLTTKMDHWAYEKEWRFINVPDGAAQRGQVIGGHELLLFDFEPSSIREIVLGANCAAETVARILDVIAAADLTLDLYQVRRNTGYGFERVKIQSLCELRLETSASGPARDLHDLTFDRFDAVLDDFWKDANADRAAGWLASFSDR